MKKLSQKLLADIVANNRKNKQITQAQLSEATGINRTMIGRIENEDYIPSIEQLQNLAETLDFDFTELFVKEESTTLLAFGFSPGTVTPLVAGIT